MINLLYFGGEVWGYIEKTVIWNSKRDDLGVKLLPFPLAGLFNIKLDIVYLAPKACANKTNGLISRCSHLVCFTQSTHKPVYPFQIFRERKKQVYEGGKGKIYRYDDVTTQLEAIEKYQVNMFLPRVTLAQVTQVKHLGASCSKNLHHGVALLKNVNSEF